MSSNYMRVIPRDLFNEANLLKCLGALWIALEGRCTSKARFHTETTQGFDIWQSQEDGSIHVANILFLVGDVSARLYRPLNSRAAWPLYMEWNDDAIRVFDDEGKLSDEFLSATAKRD